MKIYYFGTNGEKVGPIKKDGLVNLAKAGVVTEHTSFEVDGKRIKGRHIKNLRSIFEEQKNAKPDSPAPPAYVGETPPPPPVTEEPSFPLPPENTSDAVSGNGFYQFAGTGSGQSVSKTESPFKRKFQGLFNRRNRGRENAKESAQDGHQPRAYAHFRLCYRIAMIFLHVAFAIGMLNFTTGYFRAVSLRHTGERGKRDFREKLNGILRMESYRALGAFLDQTKDAGAKTDSGQNGDSRFWKKYEKLGIEESKYLAMLDEIKGDIKKAYDKIQSDPEDPAMRKPDNPNYEDRGKVIDAIFRGDEARRPNAVFQTAEPALTYLYKLNKNFDEMVMEGRIKARFDRNIIFGILAAYLNILLLYCFMSAMVTSAETTHKAVDIIEKTAKTKEDRNQEGAGGIL